jgi:hypothetical protein
MLCEILVKNLVQDRNYCLFGDNRSRIVDEGGSVFTPTQIRLAEHKLQVAKSLCARLTSRVPVISALFFDRGSIAKNGPRAPRFGLETIAASAFQRRVATDPSTGPVLPVEGTRLELVEFTFDLENYLSRTPTTIVVQFRGVPVTK